MHSAVPNTSGQSRFSIDFKTAHTDDAIAKRGGPSIDAEYTGTALGDFLLGASDLAPVPGNVISLYKDGTETSGALVYQPSQDTN